MLITKLRFHGVVFFNICVIFKHLFICLILCSLDIHVYFNVYFFNISNKRNEYPMRAICLFYCILQAMARKLD